MDLGRRVIPSRMRPCGYLCHLTMHRSGGRVMKGPFTSMRYIGRSTGSAMIPKILGAYERELHSAVEAAIGWNPDLIVDAGAAEGYYAVGLAIRLPGVRVIGYEMDASGREMLSQMAQLNGVQDQLAICAKCEPPNLQGDLAAAARPLVVCDVEGYEKVLLDPASVPALRKAAILVEAHEFIDRGITKRLEGRFAATHTVETVWQTSRSRSEFPWRTPYIRCLPASYLDWALSEWRPETMCWLWMQPK